MGRRRNAWQLIERNTLIWRQQQDTLGTTTLLLVLQGKKKCWGDWCCCGRRQTAADVSPAQYATPQYLHWEGAEGQGWRDGWTDGWMEAPLMTGLICMNAGRTLLPTAPGSHQSFHSPVMTSPRVPPCSTFSHTYWTRDIQPTQSYQLLCSLHIGARRRNAPQRSSTFINSLCLGDRKAWMNANPSSMPPAAVCILPHRGRPTCLEKRRLRMDCKLPSTPTPVQ